MNRLLKPRHLDLDPQDPFAARDWKHWKRSFDNFIIECGNEPAPDKYRAIQNLMLPHVHEMVEDCFRLGFRGENVGQTAYQDSKCDFCPSPPCYSPPTTRRTPRQIPAKTQKT